MRPLLALNIDYKVVKDPVHTSIELPSDFFRYIDDPLFQRLRQIKQTGLSHYVYPGLRHTRFEHSLGVAYLMFTSLEAIARNTSRVYGENHEATRIVRKLVEEPEYLCSAGLAALFHDLGHLAWSHTFETGLTDYTVIEAATSRVRGITVSVTRHEELTLKLSNILLEKHEGACGIDKEKLKANVSSILRLAYMSPKRVDEDELTLWVPARLLSGTIDVDRGDYLIRDSRSAGVSYGLYDLDRLINVMVAAWEPFAQTLEGAKLDIGVIDKGISVVENMLIGRMYMYSEVYLHDIVLAYEASAARLISLLLYTALQASLQGLKHVQGVERQVLRCMASVLTGEAEDVELEYCMRVLTDPAFETIIEMLATGTSTIYDELRSIEDGAWACPALSIYSRVLSERRHPSALYVSGRSADPIVAMLKPRNGSHLHPSNIRRYLKPYLEALSISPLPILIYSSPRVYDKDEPVYIVDRRTQIAYKLEDVHTSALGELLRMGVTRSKIVLAYPLETYASAQPILRSRRGKLLEDKHVLHSFLHCGYSAEDAKKILKSIGEKVRETAEALSRLASP